ncbi:hypothetical protein [Streptomyces sp. NPDC056661]|uniref:hypothetical protein n=1 Tax=Streptomyces sp. NPDC056661 TaxID=3345898 RepID=UPI00369065C3
MSDQILQERLFALASAGNIEELMMLVGDDTSEDPGQAAYKWLNVASDFGHAAADEMIDAVLEGDLYADDDNCATGHAHFELSVSYLTGRDGFPVDYGRAQEHLEAMLSRGYPDSLQDGTSLLTEARAKMNPEAQQLFDTALVSQN